MDETLKKPPLVEVIFELRWALQEEQSIQYDPHYKLLVARMFDRVQNEYPVAEELPAVLIPDKLAAYIVQHRFRVGENAWPLLQLGPGIITLNDNNKRYNWKEDFAKRIDYTITKLFETYPNRTNLKIVEVNLRYIDSIDFNKDAENILDFLENYMHTTVRVYPKLFEDQRVKPQPLEVDLRFTFPSITPLGGVHLRFAQVHQNEHNLLLWETMVRSQNDDAPNNKDALLKWAEEAHAITHDWFKEIISNLYERFK
jgi:uncharacterized protein (TIGR04255 family)